MERRLGHAESFKDLEVYKQSRVLAKNIFDLTKKFPSEEKYSLTDQIRRSSRSIGAQIAECWGKRRYENHFILKLTDADAEQYETQHWMEVSFECNYIDQSTNNDLIKRCNAIGKMLNSMIDKSSLFCKKNK
ncbi:MAG: four helix bundle protein, partial [Mariniphaga sp.]|nr:four helix bundle protein [Mariniphaga sp.]